MPYGYYCACFGMFPHNFPKFVVVVANDLLSDRKKFFWRRQRKVEFCFVVMTLYVKAQWFGLNTCSVLLKTVPNDFHGELCENRHECLMDRNGDTYISLIDDKPFCPLVPA